MLVAIFGSAVSFACLHRKMVCAVCYLIFAELVKWHAARTRQLQQRKRKGAHIAKSILSGIILRASVP